jgi:kinesin family protein 22
VVLPSLTPCKEDKTGSSLRKALSPISSNMDPQKQRTADDSNCLMLLELRTPMGSCNIVGKVTGATPLDKFIALGSNLKESLIQQYLDFLNVANKEELQKLKGIGERRAEYILELREDSPRPFKSLSDLGNIGLSSKQIQDILCKTATGIFK